MAFLETRTAEESHRSFSPMALLSIAQFGTNGFFFPAALLRQSTSGYPAWLPGVAALVGLLVSIRRFRMPVCQGNLAKSPWRKQIKPIHASLIAMSREMACSNQAVSR
jgi:hypothetical protein